MRVPILRKLAELNMKGLSAETLRSYPQPEPMPSAAYEKAQQILQKLPAEKTAGPRPDLLPQLKRLMRRDSDGPEPSKIDKALAYGGNTLAGAGAAKFTGDAVNKIRVGHFGKTPFSPRTEGSILAAGATLGLANKIRKDHRHKKWQEKDMKKAAGVANLGAEEKARLELTVLTRASAQAEAEALFSNANVSRAKAQRTVNGLFHQAPASQTMSLTLSPKAKTAAVEKFFDKLADSQMTEAQRRYPELLKVAVAPGVGTRPTPLAKKPVGAIPSASMNSGGQS